MAARPRFLPPIAAALIGLASSPAMANELALLSRTPASLEDWRAAVKDLPSLELRQSWRPEPEPALSPGRVWFVRDATHLHAFARLEDRDIRSTATAFNQFLFEHGDVFEVFVHPAGSEAYWEFHVSPTGISYQVFFDSAAGFAARRKQGLGLAELLAPYLLAEPVASVQAWPAPSDGVWHARISVPLDLLKGAGRVRLSAARYDASAGAGASVLSCTAPLTRLDFHRLDEFTWFALPNLSPSP